MSNAKHSPDLLFEVSWEVCNKVGGIHTVISTKAQTVTRKFADRYVLLGPDLSHEGVNPEFEEDPNQLKAWRQSLYNEGIRVRVGRWKIKGEPTAVLVDFSSLIPRKDEILKSLWESYHVDSISGQWDYIEPVLFGWAAGVVIASYVETFGTPTEKAVAHFHEWMTAAGGLYLRKHAPYIATVFTTHATVMGRCIAGNRLPLYNDLPKFNADELARQFNVTAKHSIEKMAAAYHDAFLTVSDITANECKYLLGREPDGVTPNGFENDFVWAGEEYYAKRDEARRAMISVAEACLGEKFTGDPLIVGTSGRYEFRNKGIDVFIESLKQLAASDRLRREVLAYITVPAGNRGPRLDLQAHLADPSKPIDAGQYRHSTHYLENATWDPIVNALKNSNLTDPGSKVKVIFVPTYLNKADGIFHKDYYELLVGMDITVFPSYYEPWGYTPLESVAFSIPTVTTTLAGFGIWVDKQREHAGVEVIRRDDYNDKEVEAKIADTLLRFSLLDEKHVNEQHTSAYEISLTALWEHLFAAYEQAYSEAVESSIVRTNRAVLDGGTKTEQINFVRQQLFVEKPVWNRMMVDKTLPKRLHALEELSRNLWWCWNPGARDLFEGIDPALWAESDRNPIAFLDKMSVERMKELEKDTNFLAQLDAVHTQFRDYMNEKPDPKATTVSYFSMEYGLHSSLKIYSGGLGILAGDYLKEASDKNVPMAAVGLLYRYGYFTQRLSAQGAQEATYEAQNFYKLPISPVRDEAGGWVTVTIAFPHALGARLEVPGGPHGPLPARCRHRGQPRRGPPDHPLPLRRRLGEPSQAGDPTGHRRHPRAASAGHQARRVPLQRGPRRIHRRRAHPRSGEPPQALVLRGAGGGALVVALHDAHPRARRSRRIPRVDDPPVHVALSRRAGHHLGAVYQPGQDQSQRPQREVLDVGAGLQPLAGGERRVVAPRRGVEGYSGQHVAGLLQKRASYRVRHQRRALPDVDRDQHAPPVRPLFRRRIRGAHLRHPGMAEGPPDSRRRAVERAHVSQEQARKAYPPPLQRPQSGASRLAAPDDSDHRGHQARRADHRFRPPLPYLLFTNLDRLSAIVNNKERPVQFIFAGKAHPNDKPGQDLIKRIVEVAAMPQFVGKILFLQNYDMELARRMVQGVDVWLNTPTRPLEASGTSGEKCVMNGVLQFSVLDGWWVEGYKEGAGWMLPMERTFADQGYQDELDAEMIYNTIEEQIVPKYYDRGSDGIPHQWVDSVKKCVADIASNFTTNRMLGDYEERFYNKLAARKREIVEGGYKLAREIAAWKRKVSAAWDKVRVIDVQRVRIDDEAIFVGEKYHFEVTVDIANLRPEDIGVEMVIAQQIVGGGKVNVTRTIGLKHTKTDGSRVTYALDYVPGEAGTFDVALRLYPYNPHLPHRMDFALVKWA